MTVCWWLVDFVSRAIEADERAAVCGDLAESGESGGEALWQVLGLIVRRQTALWKGWRSWAALVLLAAPSSLFLRFASRLLADIGAIYLWLYTNYWSWRFVDDSAYRHDLLHYVAIAFIACGALASIAWVGGLALAFVSCGSVPVTGAVFTLLLFFGTLPSASRANDYVSANAVVFQEYFYRLVFPIMLQVLVVLVPAIAGMRVNLHRKVSKESHT